jgi:adenosylmethionine-8-amino-7-oxononanoate aminotransferase
MAKVAASLRRNHLHMHKRDNLVYFAPPLVITDAELDEAIAAVGTAFDEALGS